MRPRNNYPDLRYVIILELSPRAVSLSVAFLVHCYNLQQLSFAYFVPQVSRSWPSLLRLNHLFLFTCWPLAVEGQRSWRSSLLRATLLRVSGSYVFPAKATPINQFHPRLFWVLCCPRRGSYSRLHETVRSLSPSGLKRSPPTSILGTLCTSYTCTAHYYCARAYLAPLLSHR